MVRSELGSDNPQNALALFARLSKRAYPDAGTFTYFPLPDTLQFCTDLLHIDF